jgi:eukaryotic-like serine/threonine-protein kinase
MSWAQRVANGMAHSPDEELQQSEDVLKWSIRKNGPDSALSIKAMNEVANQLARQDRVAEEVIYREQIADGLRTSVGAEHDATLSAEWKLAMCLTTLERPEEAEPLLRHVVAGRAAALGPDDPQTLTAMAWSARVAKRLAKLQ